MDMKKLETRKKAMMAMMKEKPSLQIKIKSKAMPMADEEGMEELPQMAEGEANEAPEGEMISMMVTPDEKKLLMKMRGKMGVKDKMSGESEEIDEEY